MRWNAPKQCECFVTIATQMINKYHFRVLWSTHVLLYDQQHCREQSVHLESMCMMQSRMLTAAYSINYCSGFQV